MDTFTKIHIGCNKKIWASHIRYRLSFSMRDTWFNPDNPENIIQKATVPIEFKPGVPLDPITSPPAKIYNNNSTQISEN
jgi:hypothetical protein